MGQARKWNSMEAHKLSAIKWLRSLVVSSKHAILENLFNRGIYIFKKVHQGFLKWMHDYSVLSSVPKPPHVSWKSIGQSTVWAESISQTSLKSTSFLSSLMMLCDLLPEAVKHIPRASCSHCNIHVHMCSAVHQSKLLIGGLSIISIILNKYQLIESLTSPIFLYLFWIIFFWFHLWQRP